jgi:hypothetical protein
LIRKKPQDFELETLLNLDGEIFRMEDGYWTKFEAKLVGPDENFPHGIRYSLTLHDSRNQRILGFDNAHGVKPKRKKYAGKKRTWDHKHDREKVASYEFESPGQLIEDFWRAVDMIRMKGK